MDLTESAEDATFRDEVRTWLVEHLVGEWRDLRGLGGPGRDHEAFEERLAWNRLLAEHGWTCVGWPEEHGGRGLSLFQQVIFHEEYARANAPVRVNHLGEELLGPTLMAYGTDEQKARFLPKIVAVEELWAQGYSEPDAGSDLANVKTKAVLDGNEWVVDGQKVWTSNAHFSQWIFVIARSEPGSARHQGLSFLLMPIDQDGVDVRPIEQLTGGSEFNEVFLTGARTAADLVVGEPGKGWGVAMDLLAFERGISTLAQQVGFEREMDHLIAVAQERGVASDPVMRQRLVQAWIGLQLMKWNGLRSMGSGVPGPEASISKLFWGQWHSDLGELAMDVLGMESQIAEGFPYELTLDQKLFLFTRSETIYGGSNEIQRNVLGERVLGLPKEPNPS